MFESSVILYSSKTLESRTKYEWKFESSVILYSSKTTERSFS